MRLDRATWLEVEAYLERAGGIMIPAGSNEQHGPMGLIGTDAICAGVIAEAACAQANALVAPTLCYTPAPFNTAFPGTVSISEPVFIGLVREIISGLRGQGFTYFYFLNGHGANIAPLTRLQDEMTETHLRVRSWWDFDPVNRLRERLYGEWEGMHATPSEVAITQATHRVVAPGSAATPPEKLSRDFIRDHRGDRHGPPDEHRRRFPDGRVGSHSALAHPDHGETLISTAATAVAEDYESWCGA